MLFSVEALSFTSVKKQCVIAWRYPHPLLTVSSKGHTQQFNFYRVGAESGKLILVDTPGYGKRGRPEWGDMLDEYLKTRKQSAVLVSLLVHSSRPLFQASSCLHPLQRQTRFEPLRQGDARPSVQSHVNANLNPSSSNAAVDHSICHH